MSKLNDSTLKILKKYRLDTDMSVFGNENKLHDVVKVMDDMVGNQVSKYVGDVHYLSSTRNDSINVFKATSSGKTTNVLLSFELKQPQSPILFFDPFSLKYEGKVDETASVMPLAKMYLNKNFVAYLVCEISTKSTYLSQDIYGNNIFKVSVNAGDTIYFSTFLMFSDVVYSLNSGSAFDYSSLFEFTTTNSYLTVPATTTNIITLPETILQLNINNIIYCSNISRSLRLYTNDLNISSDIKFKEV